MRDTERSATSASSCSCKYENECHCDMRTDCRILGLPTELQVRILRSVADISDAAQPTQTHLVCKEWASLYRYDTSTFGGLRELFLPTLASRLRPRGTGPGQRHSSSSFSAIDSVQGTAAADITDMQRALVVAAHYGRSEVCDEILQQMSERDIVILAFAPAVSASLRQGHFDVAGRLMRFFNERRQRYPQHTASSFATFPQDGAEEDDEEEVHEQDEHDEILDTQEHMELPLSRGGDMRLCSYPQCIVHAFGSSEKARMVAHMLTEEADTLEKGGALRDMPEHDRTSVVSSLINYASRSHDMETLQLLLSQLPSRDTSCSVLLYEAIKGGRAEVVRSVMRHGQFPYLVLMAAFNWTISANNVMVGNVFFEEQHIAGSMDAGTPVITWAQANPQEAAQQAAEHGHLDPHLHGIGQHEQQQQQGAYIEMFASYTYSQQLGNIREHPLLYAARKGVDPRMWRFLLHSPLIKTAAPNFHRYILSKVNMALWLVVYMRHRREIPDCPSNCCSKGCMSRMFCNQGSFITTYGMLLMAGATSSDKVIKSAVCMAIAFRTPESRAISAIKSLDPVASPGCPVEVAEESMGGYLKAVETYIAEELVMQSPGVRIVEEIMLNAARGGDVALWDTCARYVIPCTRTLEKAFAAALEKGASGRGVQYATISQLRCSLEGKGLFMCDAVVECCARTTSKGDRHVLELLLQEWSERRHAYKTSMQSASLKMEKAINKALEDEVCFLDSHRKHVEHAMKMESRAMLGCLYTCVSKSASAGRCDACAWMISYANSLLIEAHECHKDGTQDVFSYYATMFSCFKEAAGKGLLEVCRMLLGQHLLSVKWTCEVLEVALLSAVRGGHTEVCRFIMGQIMEMIEAGRGRDSDTEDILMIEAACNPDPEICAMLIAYQCDVRNKRRVLSFDSQQPEDMGSCLMSEYSRIEAVSSGYIDNYKMLIRNASVF